MKLRDFVKENREELTKAVLELCSNCKTTLADLEDWVRNDQGLYNWARSSGWRG